MLIGFLFCSDISARQSDVYSERHTSNPERQSSYPSFGLGNQFAFKLKITGRDGKERNHRFNCGGSQLATVLYFVDQLSFMVFLILRTESEEPGRFVSAYYCFAL